METFYVKWIFFSFLSAEAIAFSVDGSDRSSYDPRIITYVLSPLWIFNESTDELLFI